MTFAWTEERTKALTTMWMDGHSAGEIARTLGAESRNAVIGKVHRLKLPGRERKVKPKAVRKHPWRPRSRAVAAASAAKRAVKAAPALRPRTPCSLMQLTERSCRWPEGTVGQRGFFFCGAETEASVWEGCPYCPEHWARAHQP